MLFWSSHKSETALGRAYWRSRSASVFVATILEHSSTLTEFVYYTYEVMHHEYLHLFLRFRLGKWASSEKTVIAPLTRHLLKALYLNHDWVTDLKELFDDCREGWRERVEKARVSYQTGIEDFYAIR